MGILAPSDPALAGSEAGLQARAIGIRWRMLLLLFVATVINYVDRANLSVAAHGITAEFKLDPIRMGLLFSAFAWTYALFNLPAGYIVDRLGSRIALGGSMLVWSAATLLQCFSASFGGLFGLRLVVGASETSAPLASNRIVASWFPKSERGFATSGFVVGQYLGPALVTPLLFWIAANFSWRDVFSVTGAVGIAFGAVFLAVYRDPMQSRTVSAAERLHIEAGGAVARTPSSGKIHWQDVRALLGFRQIWAVCVGKFAVMSTQYFFLTWFPTYLVKARGMSLTHAGLMTSLPYLAASFGVLLSGWWSDRLFRQGASLSRARKLPIVTGFLLVSTIVFANFTTSNIVAITIISFAYFAQGMSSTSWAIVAEIAPERMIGTTSGIINFAGNLSGIVTPLIVGLIIARTGSFAWALGFVGLCALVGAVAYIFLLGPIDRLQLPERRAVGR
jgi:MFS transporter, ACS family, D-galactonate transporter